MSLGGCTTRHFKRVLELYSRFNRGAIYQYASLHLNIARTSSQNVAAPYNNFPANIRINPIPSELQLPPEERLRLIRFLNQGGSDVQSTVSSGNPRHRPSAFVQDVASSYLSVRLSPLAVRDLSVEAYLLIARQAQLKQLQQVLDMLAEDLLKHFPVDSDPEGFSRAAAGIISHARPECPLTPQRILQLYNALISLSGAKRRPALTPKGWERVFSAAVLRPEDRAFSLGSFAKTLLSGGSNTEQANANFTWITYRLLIETLMEGRESFPQALAVFQQLLQLDRVPKLAQQLAEGQGGSFKIIIASTIVRGCLEFHWYLRAAELVIQLLQDPRWSQTETPSAKDIEATSFLGLEVLHALIHSPTRHEVQICRRLIRALLPAPSTLSSARSLSPSPSVSSSPSTSASPTPILIPYADLLSFYEACYHYGLVNDAASVYVHLQSPCIRQHHNYPPPRLSALFWLFDHFADPGVSPKVEGGRPTFKGYIGMARTILSDILHRRIPVPVVDRPRFIAIAAARGFGFYARQLWELYTVESDPNRNVVRGSTQMIVPLVKLFRKLQEAWDRGVEREGSLPAPKALKQRYKSNSSSIVNKSRNVLGASPDIKRSILPDAWRFAEHVLRSYTATKQPLALASQQDLNALARAHLILDHTREGMEALSIIISRGDIPDFKDINVALGAVARYSPRRAANILKYMVKNGIRPTSSAFGALLHAALKEGDMKLMTILIYQARKLGHGELTPRAIAALVHSKISFMYTEDETQRSQQRENLKMVLEIIETIMSVSSTERQHKDHDKDHVLSVKMGQKCIEAALTAMQPEMALRFWRLLVRDRVSWEDEESRSTRSSIGLSIRQWRRPMLHDEEVATMLAELGLPAAEWPRNTVSRDVKTRQARGFQK